VCVVRYSAESRVLDIRLRAADGLRHVAFGPSLRTRRAWPFTFLAAIAVAPILVGCVGNADEPAKIPQHAHDALARWADAVAAAGGPSAVVLVGEQTGQVGDWELKVGDNNKSALMTGMVEGDARLPAGVPPDGEVRWQDGTTASVPLKSAQQAVAAIKADSPGRAAIAPRCASPRRN
jgi:hypothetical protein